VRHGVDYDHFAQAWRSPLARPSVLAGIPRPIFGFFGLIHHWVDLELMAAVAGLRPQYQFVLIGDARVDTAALRRSPNIHLLGRRPYSELPAFCAAFDAAMLLFRRNAMTVNVNPIKLYEYVAAGLPVVSTSIPEVARLQGPVRLADEPEDFAAACDQTLESAGGHSREKTSSLVAQETWESRVEVLSEMVMRCVEGRSAGVPRLRYVPPVSEPEATQARWAAG
jgi:glycosyltransferase involved in cell wall biosynthesis